MLIEITSFGYERWPKTEVTKIAVLWLSRQQHRGFHEKGMNGFDDLRLNIGYLFPVYELIIAENIR